MNNQVNLDNRNINRKARFALLYTLGEYGGYDSEIRCQDLYNPVADLLVLTETERTITIKEKSGSGEDEAWWPNTVRWARNELRKKRLLAGSTRGYWRLNKNGHRLYLQLKQQYERSNKTFEIFVDDYSVTRINND